MSATTDFTVTYSMEVRWTTRHGSKMAASWKSHQIIDPNVVFRDAAALGWTPRKWWEWWRWGDTPNPPAADLASWEGAAP